MRQITLLVLASLLVTVLPFSLRAHTPSHRDYASHRAEQPRQVRVLHFSHPLVGESPTPDSKHRLDYEFQDASGADVHTGRYTLEYRLTPGVSVETAIPYVSVDPDRGSSRDNVGTVSTELKVANPWFSNRGLLLVHGFGVGLPTGDDGEGIGSNNIWELEGVTGFGYRIAPAWQLTGFAELGIPINQDSGQPVETELGWNLALLKRLNARWEAMVELDGETVLSAEESDEDGRDVINLSPGIKYRLDAGQAHDPSHRVGVSVGFPISGPEDFDSRWLVSYFYHF